MLDFMQPQVAGGQLVGLCGKARRDEPGREGTLQHVGYIGYGEGDGKRFLSWGRPLRTVLSLGRTTFRPCAPRLFSPTDSIQVYPKDLRALAPA